MRSVRGGSILNNETSLSVEPSSDSDHDSNSMTDNAVLSSKLNLHTPSKKFQKKKQRDGKKNSIASYPQILGQNQLDKLKNSLRRKGSVDSQNIAENVT